MTARFIVLFETPADPAAFDRHFHDVHIPLARRLPGLRRYTIGRDLVAVRGGFPCYLVAELELMTLFEFPHPPLRCWPDMLTWRTHAGTGGGYTDGESGGRR
jgi:hypothetical protein